MVPTAGLRLTEERVRFDVPARGPTPLRQLGRHGPRPEYLRSWDVELTLDSNDHVRRHWITTSLGQRLGIGLAHRSGWASSGNDETGEHEVCNSGKDLRRASHRRSSLARVAGASDEITCR